MRSIAGILWALTFTIIGVAFIAALARLAAPLIV